MPNPIESRMKPGTKSQKWEKELSVQQNFPKSAKFGVPTLVTFPVFRDVFDAAGLSIANIAQGFQSNPVEELQPE